ncbi:uncharacterized protein [Medicago truncatula]|uniref:uncharacterized protein isoform X2 n=1 Tax=Medicago truncatula TaxID=3880 RepID=UPI000D2F3CFC|nr:uncharacterized protein LOC11426556 isoform X2 [Medicago truncatula]
MEFIIGDAKFQMQKFIEKIVDMMKAERLFESQGGPIIMSQIENECGPTEYEIGVSRLIPAMASIVIISIQIRITNQRCGQKLGLAGLRSLEVQFLTDLLKTWHFQLQDLYRKEGHCTIITKQI